MSDEILHRLDVLIAVAERVADAVEALRSDAESIAMETSSIARDVGTIDEYSHSMKLDMEAIRSDVSSIAIAMP